MTSGATHLASAARYRQRAREGHSRVAEYMALLEQNARDFSGAWTTIGQLYVKRELGVFAESRGGAGRRWRVLKADTIIRKRRESFPINPLVRTGALKAQLTIAEPRKSAPTYAIFGPRDSEIAHRGVRHKRGQGNAPQRDPAPPLRPKEAEQYINVMRRHVLGEGHWWEDGTV